MMSSNITNKMEISLGDLFRAMHDWMESKPEQSARLATDIDEQAEEITTALNKFIAGARCVAIKGINLYGVEAIGLDTESFSDDVCNDMGVYFKKLNGETVALMVIKEAIENKITAEKRLNGDIIVMNFIECD